MATTPTRSAAATKKPAATNSAKPAAAPKAEAAKQSVPEPHFPQVTTDKIRQTFENGEYPYEASWAARTMRPRKRSCRLNF